ncbi:hypothetical protein CLAFUW4_02518 [Fulvia fulva]|nr:hypothetical protein CLAFUR4_02513 [Fulvia fulva]KAK4633467.1 hypothetical protein CLAFUR0_02517 [Fulvia fulva]WPV11976.1 hypothetical protein CLAFUW4_02518 [Fulvia fulva]WPV25947.1 hypothetical protein CLAFUW7_02518 [Fulvia fulva]
MASSSHVATFVAIARFVGIVFPALYCGVTCDYSFTFVQPIVDHAPNQKVMAKQWYYGYRTGPLWVPPLVAPGTFSNLFLAYIAKDPFQQNFYLAAAMGIFSILPITFLYMEPGINGAAKWKTQTLLKDEGFSLPETTIFMPSARKHGGTQASRRWAEKTDMKELILHWRFINNFRWVIGGIAAVLSGYATLSQLAV